MNSWIEVAAAEFRVDTDLLTAICTVESSLEPLAMRFEPGWRYFYQVVDFAELNRITPETERVLQASSFGLGQVMGAVMREHGYTGPLQRALSDPLLAVRYSAKHLRRFLDKYTEVEAISAYNQGSPRKTPGGLFENQRYVDKVSRVLRSLRAPTV